MSDPIRPSAVTRREILKAGAATAAVAASASILSAAENVTSAPASQAAGSQSAATAPLPMRPLGKTGAKVSVVNLGCGKPPTQRILDRAYELGVRYFDTANSYGKGKSEEEIGKWFERTGKRKEIFLVSKDGVSRPENLLARIDERLKALRTDYLDAYFLHGLGDRKQEQSPDWVTGEEFKQTADKLRKSGKVRFVGFSSHSPDAPAYLAAAAKGGYVDLIMVSYNPVAGDKKDQALDDALNACHKAGIGLIAMKTTRGIKQTLDADKIDDMAIHQAIIKAVLSDTRIASVCSAMENFLQLEQNTQVARDLGRPLTSAQWEQLRHVVRKAGLAYCPGCQACRDGIAATHPHVHEATRYLSYFEQDGRRGVAREMYRALPAGSLSVPDDVLTAARDACSYHVDYPALIARAAASLA